MGLVQHRRHQHNKFHPGISVGKDVDNDNLLDVWAEPSLAHSVSALPEIYQPLYGHPELSNHVMRECEDRLTPITKIYRMLESRLDRSLHVLDLGCAQGFFSLHLAKLGATVHGVDLCDGNIAVCETLAKENPDLKVSFQAGMIEEIIIGLELSRYAGMLHKKCLLSSPPKRRQAFTNWRWQRNPCHGRLHYHRTADIF
jgi:SAM-dependent methyltransferase